MISTSRMRPGTARKKVKTGHRVTVTDDRAASDGQTHVEELQAVINRLCMARLEDAERYERTGKMLASLQRTVDSLVRELEALEDPFSDDEEFCLPKERCPSCGERRKDELRCDDCELHCEICGTVYEPYTPGDKTRRNG